MGHIDAVPDEILVRFFDGCQMPKDLFHCSLVSKRWFEVSQEHPLFWSCAQVGMRHSIPDFLRRINRRNGLPVKVRFFCATQKEEYLPIFEALAANMHRITDLLIHTWHEDRLLDALCVPMPLLRALSIVCSRTRLDAIIPAPSRLVDYISQLTSIELEEATFVFQPPGTLTFPSVLHVGVTRLAYDARHRFDSDVNEDPRWLLPFDALDRIVAMFPRMQTLSLNLWAHYRDTVSWPDVELQPPPPFPAEPPSQNTLHMLRSLKRLEVRGCTSAWNTLQHLPLHCIPEIALRVEYRDPEIGIACVPTRPYTVHLGLHLSLTGSRFVGMGEFMGLIEVASEDGTQKRTLTGFTDVEFEPFWDAPVVGSIVASQPWHLVAISLTELAWEALLASGVHDLPVLWALRIDFSRLPDPPSPYRASADDMATLSCPVLRLLIFEADGWEDHGGRSVDVESFVVDIEADMGNVTLALRGVDLAVFTSPEAQRTQFVRVTTVAHGSTEDWFARARNLLEA